MSHKMYDVFWTVSKYPTDQSAVWNSNKAIGPLNICNLIFVNLREMNRLETKEIVKILKSISVSYDFKKIYISLIKVNLILTWYLVSKKGTFH